MKRRKYGTPTHKKRFGEFIAIAYVDHIAGPTITVSHPDTERIAELNPIPSWTPGEDKYFVYFENISEKYHSAELSWSQALHVAFNYVKPDTVSSQTVDFLVTADILGEDSLDDKGWTKL